MDADAESETRDSVAEAFLAGSNDALKAAYDEHGGLIYSYCRRQLGDDAARDVTQEVFLSAWRARHTYKPDRGSLGAWLMGIAKNRVIDRHRKNSRQVPRAQGEYEHALNDKAENVADRMVLADALARLPDRQRTVMELAFYKDLTQSQIAERADLPLGTVKSDMRRGLAKLKHDLERDHG